MTSVLRGLAFAGSFLIPQGTAQACLTTPQSARGWLGARVALTSLEQRLVGAELGVRVGRSVATRVDVDLVRFDGQTPARRRTRAGVVVGRREWPVPVCFTTSGAITQVGDLSILSIPIGIAAAWKMPLASDGSTWTAFIEPRLAYRRAALLGFRSVSMPSRC